MEPPPLPTPIYFLWCGSNFTCTKRRAVIDIWGFSEGAVCATDIMMVSANHNRGLDKRRNMRHWKRFHLALDTRHLWWNHLGRQKRLTETLPSATALFMAKAMETLPFWSEYRILAWDPTTWGEEIKVIGNEMHGVLHYILTLTFGLITTTCNLKCISLTQILPISWTRKFS